MMNNHVEVPIRTDTNSTGTYYNNPYVNVSPAPTSTKTPMDMIVERLNRCGKSLEDVSRKAEVIADNVWQHLRISPSVTDAARARLAQGTKVLTEGHENVFHQAFQYFPGEKLLNSYACYLSTSSGPVIGTLYLSTKRVAFCSDYPLCYYSSPGQPEWRHYKVVVELDQLRAINPSANRSNPSEKYIQIVTRDGYEFWFVGFISYDKALKNLNEALQGFRQCSG